MGGPGLRSFPPELRREIAEKYKAGEYTAVDIARRYGVGSTTIYRLLEEFGIKRDRKAWEERAKKFPPEVRREWIGLYEAEGLSLAQIAERYDCSMWTIKNALKSMGVKIAKRGQRFKDIREPEKVIPLYKQGWSQIEIAKEMGCSYHTIGQWLRQHGITQVNMAAERHPGWRGGRSVGRDGYVLVVVPYDSPYAAMRRTGGYCLEHRYVMAQALGRCLYDHETVHHIDGDTSNNDISNLQLRIGKHGRGAAFMCADCGSHNVIPAKLKDAPEDEGHGRAH